MADETLASRFQRYYDGNATPDDITILRSSFEGIEGEKLLAQLMEAHWQQLQSADAEFLSYKKEAMWQALTGGETKASSKVPSPLRKLWWAAAAVIILLGSGIFIWQSGKHKDNAYISSQIPNVQAPTGVHAVITLANGQKIYLDSTGSGTIAAQGSSSLIKSPNGDVIYHGGNGSAITALNTLSVPPGSKITHITLSDGTQVWLNASSKLTYPVAFSGKKRNVALSGEAYFEVAHNAAMPFRVKTRDQTIEVLGTHFNIDAYDDEATAKTTLLEGKVKVTKGLQQLTLHPGEQAVDKTGSALAHNLHPDLEQVMAWKSGLFNFNNNDLSSVMRQLSRWYGIQVRFEGAVPDRKFGGELPMDLNLSEVLQLLGKMNVHFSMEGNTLVVGQ